MSFRSFRLHLTLLLVTLYMLLDAAFMLVRVPPGTINSVPTGEILILFFLVTVVVDTKYIGPFFQSVPAVPLAIWWFVGATQLVIGLGAHGFWAMRDATSLIESIFLWIGFVVAAVPGAIEKTITAFNRILFLAALIILTYPFRDILGAISPVIISAVMVPTPLFFTYNLTPLLSLVMGLRLLVQDTRHFGVKSAWIASFLFIFVAALLQARQIYLMIFFLVALLGLTKPGNVFRLLGPLTAAIALFLILLAAGVPVPGRLSQSVSLSFYLEHFWAIGGQGAVDSETDPAIAGAAGGVNQRFFWWRAIWAQVTASWTSILFGLGYGVSLVGLAQDVFIDANVREPHNSLVSALGRTGFVGLIAYTWLHIQLAVTLVRTYRSYKQRGARRETEWLYLVGAMFALYWIAAIGEDAFEKPFVAISYYFFYGVILNMSYRSTYAANARALIKRRRLMQEEPVAKHARLV